MEHDSQRNDPVEVVILGMHRSGTSMIAGLLTRLGVHMGDKLVGACWSNPMGHFEDQEFYELNERILRAAGGTWDAPPGREAILRQADTFNGEIATLVGGRTPRAWGWKDPRTCLTAELFLPHLRNARFIVCHRQAASIAASLERRNRMETEAALELTRAYEEGMDSLFTSHPGLARIDLDYRAVLDDPGAAVGQIVEFLGLEPSPSARHHAAALVLPRNRVRWLSIRTRVARALDTFAEALRLPGRAVKRLAKRVRDAD